MRGRMVQHGQKLLPRLPANQLGILAPAAARALQHTPIAEYQRSRDFFDGRVGKRLQNDFRADSRRIAHGDGDDRFTHHRRKSSQLDNEVIIRA